jgi:hypothetical protein
MKASIRSVAVVLAAAALAAGCVSGDKLIGSAAPTIGTPLLARFVSMGNSITAGMQSAGINDSTQKQAYPVLLARMANVPFVYPSLTKPGCPPPYTAPLGATGRLGGGTSTTCFLRASFQGLVNNVAVPGEYVADLNSPAQAGANNALGMFINGGLTEVQAMAAQQPTFVTLWAPNNDVLNAVNLGDTTAAVLTPLASYTASLNAAVNAIKTANPQGAVLIGVVNVPAFAPVVQPGAFFFAAYSQAVGAGQPSPFGKPVDPSCSPFTQTGQPNAFGGNLVSFQAAADPSVTVIKCTPDAKWVTTTSVAGAAGGNAELPVFLTRIAQINAAVQAAATSNNWIYVDPNTALGATALADPSKFRKCQGLATATDLASFQAAVLNTCPGPTAPNYFGSMVSFDATHPSFAFHQAFASYLAGVINTKYGTSITTTAPTALIVAR